VSRTVDRNASGAVRVDGPGHSFLQRGASATSRGEREASHWTSDQRPELEECPDCAQDDAVPEYGGAAMSAWRPSLRGDRVGSCARRNYNFSW
jgi:hypothetical protein